MKSLPPILAVLSVVLLLLGGYVGAYLGLGEKEDITLSSATITRVYPSGWMVVVFAPATWVESMLRGEEVEALYESDETDETFN